MSSQHQQTDIAIVGGGLVGVSLTLMLARLLPSISISLFDRHAIAVEQPSQLAQASFDARSSALSPSTINLLKCLDIWPQLQSQAAPIKQIHVTDRGHAGHVCLDQADNGGEPLGYVVENKLLGWALTSALVSCPNVRLYAPSAVSKAQIKPGGAVLELEQGNTVKSQLLIVADGAESEIRQQLGITVQRRPYNQHAIVANVSVSQGHQNVAYERFTSSGPLALLPIPGGNGKHMSMVWSWPSEDYEQALALTKNEFLEQLQAAFGYRLGRFVQLSERAAYPLSLVVANEQVRRHLVIMGNAAHFLHPVAGQGFNLAARDALRLAQVLVEADAAQLGDLTLLQNYQRQQSDDQFRTLFLSDGFHRWFSNNNPLKQVLRNLGMAAVQHNRLVRHSFIEHMSGRAAPAAFPWSKT